MADRRFAATHRATHEGAGERLKAIAPCEDQCPENRREGIFIVMDKRCIERLAWVWWEDAPLVVMLPEVRCVVDDLDNR
jgi:hypothetical protein